MTKHKTIISIIALLVAVLSLHGQDVSNDVADEAAALRALIEQYEANNGEVDAAFEPEPIPVPEAAMPPVQAAVPQVNAPVANTGASIPHPDITEMSPQIPSAGLTINDPVGGAALKRPAIPNVTAPTADVPKVTSSDFVEISDEPSSPLKFEPISADETAVQEAVSNIAPEVAVETPMINSTADAPKVEEGVDMKTEKKPQVKKQVSKPSPKKKTTSARKKTTVTTSKPSTTKPTVTAVKKAAPEAEKPKENLTPHAVAKQVSPQRFFGGLTRRRGAIFKRTVAPPKESTDAATDAVEEIKKAPETKKGLLNRVVDARR